jgi:hypothetical protein
MANKPMIIAIEEGEQILINAVNNVIANGVTPYFLKMIYEKVGAQIDNLAKEEVNSVKDNWQNQIAEENKENSEIPQT